MTDHLKTIREVRDLLARLNDDSNYDHDGCFQHWAEYEPGKLIAALDALEQAMREPVAFVHWPIHGAPRLVWYGNKPLGAAIIKSYEGHQPDMLLFAAPPAQQAQPTDFADAYQGAMEEVAIWKRRALEAEELNRKFMAEINGATFMGEPAQQAQPSNLQAIEQYRMQMAGISTAALGYWKEGDSIHLDYDTVALRDVAKLYAKYDELYRKQAQAEAVQACGHPMSLLLRSAESNEPLYCEACDDKSGRHDAERRETELLDANRRLQEKIGSADALKLHAIEELCQLGYTVKDGELFPPDHLHKLMEAANHPLCGKQTEAVPDCGEAGHDEGCCGNRDCLPSARKKAPQQAEAVPCGNRDHCGRFPFCGCGDSDSLPERDTNKTAEQQGLFRKFVVRRTDGSDSPGGKHDGCEYFVLDVDHDKHAKTALAAYAASVEETHPQLAADMRGRYQLAAPQQAEAVPQGWGEHEIAQAAMEAEIPDSKLESLLLALPKRTASPQPKEQSK